MKKRNIFWGLLFVAIAIFLVVNQLGWLSGEIGVWSIVLGVFFAGTLLNGIADRSFGGIFFSLAFLWIIFAKSLGFPHIPNFEVLLVALFLSIGCSFLFPKKKWREHHHNHGKWDAYDDENEQGEYQQVVDEMDKDHVYCSNKFGAITKYVNTTDFKGARLENSFGELKVYFDRAQIQQGPIQVEVHASFGHMELYIPKEWNVLHNVNMTLGTVEEKNRNQTTGEPVMDLVGDVSFGAITIIYV